MRDHILTSEILANCDGIRFAFTTRSGGVSPEPYGMNISYRVGDDPRLVTENRGGLFRRLGIQEEDVAVPRQCHSVEVKVVSQGGPVDRTDGLLTDVPNVWLSVSVADCVPLFMVDRSQRAIGAVHAGWRGSAARIAERAVRTMAETFGTDPRDLSVFIGPSAGKCCYQVGREVAEQFDSAVIARRDSSLYLDLKRENQRQLEGMGVPKENIEVSSYCTICTPALFHSYRRDRGRSGRMLGIIGMIEGGS